MKCPQCEETVSKSSLKWYSEVDGDEGGCYVIYVARCPHCFTEVKRKFGYETNPDEPLRHET